MPTPKLAAIVSHLDRYLRHAEVTDYSGAWNGLQVENSGRVRKVGAAVDACAATIEAAVEQGIDLLLVHHGLFWGGVQPLTGVTRRKVKMAFDNDLAIYSSHLPLDLHPEVGNNMLLCRALGFKKCTPFFPSKGQAIGLQTRLTLSREDLTRRLEKVLGVKPHLSPGGPAKTTKIGVVTGGAGGEVAQAAAEGVDTFITGEGPHHSYTAAEELGVNLYYGGHYATETFGVKALAAYVGTRYRVPWEFLDHPTGL
ncbi:MAG: Nif3-like dinuclear metal center hexameric protein [Prosthecobacter sp.]|nr:Nif3-like dinuclear metal center hexameric protein [Prosthecobacter sp.]